MIITIMVWVLVCVIAVLGYFVLKTEVVFHNRIRLIDAICSYNIDLINKANDNFLESLGNMEYDETAEKSLNDRLENLNYISYDIVDSEDSESIGSLLGIEKWNYENLVPTDVLVKIKPFIKSYKEASGAMRKEEKATTFEGTVDELKEKGKVTL